MRSSLFYFAIALACSVALWTYVRLNEGPVSVPFVEKVQFVNIPGPDLQVTSSPRMVTVTVEGAPDLVNRLAPQEVVASVDLQGIHPGEDFQRPVKCDTVVHAEALQCRASPASVTLSVDQLVSKPVPVTPRLVGVPPFGYRFEPAQVTPPEAEVRGLSRFVNRVHLLLASTRIGSSAVDVSVPLLPLDADERRVRNVQLVPPSVRLQARLVQQPQSKKIVVSPVIIGRPDPAWVVTEEDVTPSQVVARGDARRLQELDHVSTLPVVIEAAKGYAVTKQIQLETLPGIAYDVDTVTVTVKLRPVAAPPVGGTTGG